MPADSKKVTFVVVSQKQLVKKLDPKPARVPEYEFTGKTFYEKRRT